MVYKPFSNKEKLINTWNQVEENEATIKNFIQQFDTEIQKKYHSIHNFKGGVEIQLGTATVSFPQSVHQFLIKDLPEDLINFSKPRILMSVPSVYDLTNSISNPSAAFGAGTLKLGDILVGTNNRIVHWWTQIGERDWHLNIGVSASIQVCNFVAYPGGFSFIQIPKTITMSLTFYNGREFPEIQSGK